MMLDIANTVVARGKIFLARQKGIPIPENWAMDAHGRRTIDPVAALGCVILPMAEHKGYAISVMMDVLSGVLSGSSIMTEVNGPYQAEKRSRCGHMVMALDIEAFGPRAQFDARMEQMIARIKDVPLAEGFEEVFYPGEIEARNEERSAREGLDLPEQTRLDLTKCARELFATGEADMTMDTGAHATSIGQLRAAWRERPGTVLLPGHDQGLMLEAEVRLGPCGARDCTVEARFGASLLKKTTFDLSAAAP